MRRRRLYGDPVRRWGDDLLTVLDRQDFDAVLGRAEAAGATVVTRPATLPWGHLATFADPDGHLWQVIHAPAG